MSRHFAWIGLGFLASASLAQAAPLPGFQAFLRNELGAVGNAVNSCSDQTIGISTDSEEQSFYFRRVWLRLRPYIKFSLPMAASLQVTPEVEMLFERPIPAGWQVYKP